MQRLMIILVSYLFCLMGTALAAVNINTASEAELDTLPGIGPSKAAAIVAYRTEHGPFASISDLSKVQGIGNKTVSKLSSHISVGDGDATAAASTATKSTAPTTKVETAATSNPNAINVNTASASELTKLNGVGPATAKKIITYRETNGPFATCDQLQSVKGIGAKTVQKLKPDCKTAE